LLFLLKNLSKISDNGILKLNDGGITTISASEDSNMYLYTTVAGDFPKCELHLPSIKRLESAVRLINEEDFEFILNRNHLEYKSEDIKFKYHLHEEGVLSKPKISIDKIKSFNYNIEFYLSQEFLATLLKNSSVVGQNKLYIYTEDDKLFWKIGDDEKTNSDSLVMAHESDVDFELQKLILNIDNFKNLTDMSGCELLFKINSKIGLGCIVCEKNDVTLSYIFTSLVK